MSRWVEKTQCVVDRSPSTQLPIHPSPHSLTSISLHRYAVLTAIATFTLLIAGGLVTSTDSGLAVPDWPLSYGTWFPPMVGGIRYEHGHRMIAGLVGLMILGLAAWLWKAEPRRWVRRLGYAALGAVMLQALLGGLTVLWLLPPAISIAHACLGQTVFCLVVCLAISTAPHWSEYPEPVASPHAVLLRRVGVSVAVLAAMQLMLGAVIRHTGRGVPAHVICAAALVLVSLWFASLLVRYRRTTPRLWSHAVRLLLWLGIQVSLGLSVFLHRADVLIRTAHVAIGALVLAQAVVLAWQTLHAGVRHFRATRCLTPGAKDASHAWRAYVELTKPRLTSLVLMTSAAGFWLGMRRPEQWRTLVPLLLGTALVAGGANALNEWMERDLDALMHRTQRRPLPSRRLRPAAALRFGLTCSLLGVALLLVFVNPLSALLALVSWISYVLVYTPMKRRTSLCTLVGAIPGALPPMIGWAGARGALGSEAWALFTILFVWQLPHFLALAVLYRDDYARARFRLLPLLEPKGIITARQMVWYGLALLPVSLFPAFLGLAGMRYVYGALILGLLFFGLAVRAAWMRSAQSARQLFRASLVYLPILLVLLAWNKSPSLMAHPCCGSLAPVQLDGLPCDDVVRPAHA